MSVTSGNAERVVIVTGGTRGLGFAMLQSLRAAGYPVATCGRKTTPQLEAMLAAPEHEGQLFYHPCQIGVEKEEEEFFAKAIAWRGSKRFWALVNNAGIAGEGILATFPNVDSERILNVNLIGALRLARLAVRIMLQNMAGGRIVNISSIIGIRGYTGLAAYSASKAGMDGFTRGLAREVGRRKITVNSIAPGYLRTDMSALLSDDQQRQIVRRTPLLRLGTPDDVTPLLRFLLSDEAGFITGQTLVVDGGITS